MEDVNVPNVGETFSSNSELKNASQKTSEKLPKRQTTNQQQPTIPVHSRVFFGEKSIFSKPGTNIDMKRSAAHMSGVIGLSHNPSY